MELITLPGRSASRYYGHVHNIWALPGGREVFVLTGSDEGPSRLTRWDLAAGAASGVAKVATDPEHGICWPPPLFSVDFSVMTLGGYVKRVGKKRRVPLGGDEYPEPFAITPDGSQVFGGVNSVRSGDPWPVLRWDLAGAFRRGAERVELAELLPFPDSSGLNAVAAGAVSPDGSVLAALPYSSNRVFRWRLPGCDPLPPLPLTGTVDAAGVRFSPDGQTLAVSEYAGVQLLDAAGGGARVMIPAGSPPGSRSRRIRAGW